MKITRIWPAALLTLFFIGLPQATWAYVGPGAGITAIGAVLALFGGLVLAVFGFVWYPLKRLRRSKTKKAVSGQHPDK